MSEYQNTSKEVETATTGRRGPIARDVRLAQVEIVVLVLLFGVAVFGNSAALVVLLRSARRKKLNHMKEMALHLVCADLSVAFLNVLPQLCWDITGSFVGGDILCRFVKYCQVLTMYASSYVLLTTALDRYLAICHPLKFVFRTRRMHAMAGMAWIVSLIFASPQLFFFSARFKHDSYNCWANFGSALIAQLYVTWFCVVIYVIPSLVLVVLYLRVYSVVRWRVWLKSSVVTESQNNLPKRTSSMSFEERNFLRRSVSKDAGNATRSFKRTPISSAKVRTAHYTATVIGSYLICWGPFFCVLLWSQWDAAAPVEGKYPSLSLQFR